MSVHIIGIMFVKVLWAFFHGGYITSGADDRT